MAGNLISRRGVLSYGLGVAGATYAGIVAKKRIEGAHPPAVTPARPRPARALPTPRVLSSQDGELRVVLTAQPGVVDMGARKLVRTYTYGNTVPGYTWEVRPGDTLRIRLRNRLPHLHEPVIRMDRPHEWTTTNLHTHGLHVSPSGNADNVFLTVPPGADHQLEIPLPRDHPGGLFWYHPHRHGGVTQQIRAGMAGALIVRGAIDEVEEVRAAREHVMVLQSIELGDDYQLLDPIRDPAPDQSFFPRTNVLYTVNGVLTPTLRMYPGEVQRWRLLNAAEGTFMSLHLAGHHFNVLAWDGLTLPAPDPGAVLMLSAGNRADVLVRAGRPGRYDLVLTPGSSQHPDIPGMPSAGSPTSGRDMRPMPGFPAVRGELEPRTILTVEVAGQGPAMGLPTALPAWNPPILPIAAHRKLSYTVQRTLSHRFLNFGVDGIPFNPDRTPYRPVLGTAQEWTLVNAFDPKLMEHAHVFHIHTNPFKITKRNGVKLDPPLWRDTYVLTKSAGDSITFESNFVDFAGKFVDHCHVVSHEDLGMMESVEVIPPGESGKP
ncbi:MAG: multicopper oxidase family protein [Streptosporangiaceae bacterium]